MSKSEDTTGSPSLCETRFKTFLGLLLFLKCPLPPSGPGTLLLTL